MDCSEDAAPGAVKCSVGADARPLFAFPGIWRGYKGPVKKDGPNVDIETYAFSTITPNPLVATINHERMPVLLAREEEFEAWLKGSPDEAFAPAREHPPDRMRMVQEGFDKEDLLRVAYGAAPQAKVCLPRSAQVSGRDATRGGVYRRRSFGDHRAVARDGRALRPGGEPAKAGCCGDPEVGGALRDGRLGGSGRIGIAKRR
jgi:hypothetical protein